MAYQQEKETLHSVVISCFSAILSGDHQRRKDAEEELKALEVTEDFGLVLAEITVTPEGPASYRQLASLVLKQYIKSHWSDTTEYSELILGEERKAIIRQLLLKGLGDSLSKIRSAVAYAISTIAQYDWPENWPDLFDQLMVRLSSGFVDLVHGTMRVLTEFCQEISDTQIPHVAPVILPHLIVVIKSPQLYSAHTRSRAINIFRNLSQLIYSMSDLVPETTNNLLFPVLPTYIEHFVQLLSSHDDVNTGPGLRKEVITTLDCLLTHYPMLLRPHLMTIVTPIWDVLVSSTDIYIRNVVNSCDSFVDDYDSDGEIINFDSVLFGIFQFISTLLDYGHQPQLFPPILHELVDHLVSLMQIMTWESDVSRFMEDDESELAFSVRLGAYELLLQLSEEKTLKITVIETIHSVVDQKLAQPLYGNQTEHWKIHEVCLWVIGAIMIDEGKQFNGQQFVENVLLPDLNWSISPLLTGRCLWVAGKISDQLSVPTLEKCLLATVSGLNSTQHGIVRVMAAKACYHFCCNLKESDHLSLLSLFLPYFITELCEIASESGNDILFVVLDSLQKVCQVNETITASHVERIVPLSLALFLKFAHDPAIQSCLEDLFQTLAVNLGCHSLLHNRIVPTAIDLLSASESQIPLGLISATLDILVIIIRGCIPPLSPLFMNQLFKITVTKILSSEDPAILQSGGECIRAYLSVAADQLIEWLDDTGQSGLHYIAKVVIHLLDPTRPEYSAAFVDKLIIVFIKKVGSHLGNYLELLLRSVLSKMQQAQTPSVMQSLLIVFAHLASNQHLEGLLSFLSQVPDPTGQPALKYVVTEWCIRHSCFFGNYEQKISTMALCQMLSHCVNTGDQRLSNIVVIEEDLSTIHEGVTTRSKKASDRRWMHTPLPVKLLKVLISDLRSQLESEDENEYDLEEPWDNEINECDEMTSNLESLLNDIDGINEEDECDDPDWKDEELVKVDLHSHLIQYLTELSRQPCFPSLFLHLSPFEKETLSYVGAIS